LELDEESASSLGQNVWVKSKSPIDGGVGLSTVQACLYSTSTSWLGIPRVGGLALSIDGPMLLIKDDANYVLTHAQMEYHFPATHADLVIIL